MIGGLAPWHPAAGGGQIIAYKLAEAIARAGHHVDYVAIAPEQSQRKVDWGEIIYTPGEKIPSRIMQPEKLKTYDVVHVHTANETVGQYAAHVIRRALSPRPRLALGIYAPQAYGFPRSPSEAGWMTLCRAADVIFSLSEFSKHNIARAYHVSRSKITVMYGGVDKSFFLPREEKAQKPYKLLFCGRLAGRLQGRRQQKGIDILLQALPTILAQHQVKLDIVGSGPLLEAFQALVHNLQLEDHVEFAGFVEHDQMPSRYADADLFILPSRRESFGLVIAEAMAASLPVVATRVGAIPEIVQDSETGILIPPENLMALTKAINDLLSDTQRMKAMGTKGKQRVQDLFTWDKAAQRVLNAYQYILSR
jgi:glycosyltransferase involved in cell wall biosynthesis